MAEIANITSKQSIESNLEDWCFEIGSEHEAHTKENAKLFSKYLTNNKVVDFGSGDGAANLGFPKGTEITAVDINQEKLDKNTAQIKINKDFVTYLKDVDSVDNLFMHHTLEHYVDYKTVLKLLTQKVKGAIFIAVPARDDIHSSHHVSFSFIDEIVLPGFEIKIAEERPFGNGLYELIFIGIKK